MEYLGGGSALDLVSWGPSELGDPGGWGAQGAVLSFCLFILLMGFSRQEY